MSRVEVGRADIKRNDIEHHSTPESAAKVKALLYESFIVVSGFLDEHLGVEPVALLGEKTWNVLLQHARVYKQQLDECNAEHAKVEWPAEAYERIATYLVCGKCSSELIKPVNPTEKDPLSLQYICKSCGAMFEYSELVEAAVAECFFADNYVASKDGCDPATEMCHECDKDTYVQEIDKCVACGAGRMFTKCMRCSAPLSVGEHDLNGLCGYCHHTLVTDD